VCDRARRRTAGCGNTQDYASARRRSRRLKCGSGRRRLAARFIVRSARRGAPARLLSRGAAGAGVSATVPLEDSRA
jgi:hypothetical protein